MRRTSLSRITRLESRANVDELKITITHRFVDRDENGKLFISHGYRHTIGSDEPEEYLPREHFKDEDPTPVNLLHKER